MTSTINRQTIGEEIANSVTHGIAAVFSVAALAILVVFAAVRGTAWHIVSCAIFGVTLILLYLASTLYHALPVGRAKEVCRILDHASIYLLIAGTYTPFTLVTLRGPWGWSIFGVVWGLAVAGIVFQSLLIGRLPVLSTSVYVLMGWVVVIALRPLIHALPWGGLLWMLAGGLCYTAGVYFYASRSKFAHAVWHLFVIAGSLCHFFAVLLYVIPR